MPTLTLAIPKDLKEDMDSMPELNWSEIARKAIAQRIAEYKLFKQIVSKSKLTQKDVKELGDKINESLYKSYKERLRIKNAPSN